MSDKKQSSVEWLHEQLTLTWYDYNSSKDILEQAKAMHKQEIIEAWDNSAIDATYGNKFSSPEQYYKETYGGNNERQKTKQR